VIRQAAAVLLVSAALGVAGCTGKLNLGKEPPVWLADHETGDLSQWIAGEGDAGVVVASEGTLTVESDQVHSGTSAVLATITTADGLSFARLNHRNVPQDSRFSAWFYIPQRYTILGYWSLFEFQGLAFPAIDTTEITLWSVDLRGSGDGELTWYLWDNLRSVEYGPAVPLAAPIGRWFRIEAFVHQATDDSGRMTVWIDGTKLAEVSGVSTVPTPWLGWSVGSTSNAIAEDSVELYLDDATIVASRR
jgi:hypothetical protein